MSVTLTRPHLLFPFKSLFIRESQLSVQLLSSAMLLTNTAETFICGSCPLQRPLVGQRLALEFHNESEKRVSYSPS